MPRHTTRRDFLQSASAASVAFWLLPEGLARGYAANEKLDIALVGCGGRGSWFVDTIPRIGENLVARGGRSRLLPRA